jgi:hypothetical protein
VAFIIVTNESHDRCRFSSCRTGRDSPFAHSVRPAGLLISVIAGSRGSEFDPKIDFVGLLKIMCRPSMSR